MHVGWRAGDGKIKNNTLESSLLERGVSAKAGIHGTGESDCAIPTSLVMSGLCQTIPAIARKRLGIFRVKIFSLFSLAQHGKVNVVVLTRPYIARLSI